MKHYESLITFLIGLQPIFILFLLQPTLEPATVKKQVTLRDSILKRMSVRLSVIPTQILKKLREGTKVSFANLSNCKRHY